MPRGKRQRYAVDEKRWLREYVETNPLTKLEGVRVEFEARFNKAIPQSTISTILSAKDSLTESSTVSGTAEFMPHDATSVTNGQPTFQVATYEGSVQHEGQIAALDETIPRDAGAGHHPRGSIEILDPVFLHSTNQQHQIDVLPTEAFAPQANTYGPDKTFMPVVFPGESLMPVLFQNEATQDQVLDNQLDYVQPSCAHYPPAGQRIMDEWMHEFTNGAESLNISPTVNSTCGFLHDSSTRYSLNDRQLAPRASQSPLPCPTVTSQYPEIDTQSYLSIEERQFPHTSLEDRPTKRRRVQKMDVNGNTSLAENFRTLQSLYETSETSLRSSAFNMVCRALINILAFTTNKYRERAQTDTSLFKILVNALRNSPSFTLHKARLSTSQPRPSVHPFSQTDPCKQHQRQKNLVYSCYSDSTRIDLIARKRFGEAESLQERREKQSLKKDRARSSEADDCSVCFFGTIVITPRVGSAQLIFKISQKITPCVNIFQAPKISFRLKIPSSSEIFKIAAFGTVSQLREIIEKGTESWNVCDENSVSPIHYAAAALNIENCAYLLELIEDVDLIEPTSILVPSDQQTIIRFEKPFMVSIFLFPSYNFSKVNDETRDKITAWCKLLLERGADPSLLVFVDENMNIFEYFLEVHSLATLKNLLKNGAPFIGPNSTGYLASPDNLFPLLILGRKFAYPSTDSFGLTQKIFHLLEKGADVNAHDSEGWTCLHWIVSYRNLRCAWNVVEWNTYNWTQYCKQRREDAEKILIALVNAGADVFARSKLGWSVSEFASCRRIKLWVKVLKTCGYDYWKVLAQGGLDIQVIDGRGMLDTGEDLEGDEDDEVDGDDEVDEVDGDDEDDENNEDDEDGIGREDDIGSDDEIDNSRKTDSDEDM